MNDEFYAEAALTVILAAMLATASLALTAFWS